MHALDLNNLTCRNCRKELGAGRCENGQVCLCPKDDQPLYIHARTGKCPIGKLVRTDITVSEPVTLTSPVRPKPPENPKGPGTELKKLLAKCGVHPSPNCSCNARALIMDQEGPDWCAGHLDQILGWLREEHARQGIKLPFVERMVRAVVKRAIHNARKAV
jgi:hypothetical protein